MTKSIPYDIIKIVKEREENKMTREKMMDKVIKTRGLEDEKTIWYCGLCENYRLTEDALFSAIIVALAYPIDIEE